MSLNPLNELKRRLDSDSTLLSKRLCLARNIVLSHHFPTTPKERVVADWLERLLDKNQLSGDELKDLIGWLKDAEDLTAGLKGRLIQIVSQYLQRNSLRADDIPHIVTFLENAKISSQLTQQIDDYLSIVVTVLQYLKRTELELDESVRNSLSQNLLNNIINFYKECKKKLEFIQKLLNGVHLETIFSFLEPSRKSVIDVCQSILFPMNKKSFFVSFMQTLIRKDNIDDLMAEKGENIQSVLVIMSAFFTFPKSRTAKDHKFLSDFIDIFVSCFKNESQLIFAFYIMATNSLNMDQSYLSPAMKMPPIIFEANDGKVKRGLFLKMLEILLRNEVDISVRLTDTIGDKVSKVEIKKNFTSFLQTVMLGQLKLEGKVDKSTLQMMITALKLDPILIEQRINQILPPLMTAKKCNPSVIETYTEMLNCLLEVLFKLGRGISFLNTILPHVKICLEASNTDQFELKQKLQEILDSGGDSDKINSKIITGSDIFPKDCVEMYGKLTSELLFRQNKELLVSLQKDFEEHCLIMLEAGFVSPSIITLASVLAAILSSVLSHNKMADHGAPRPIAEDFWSAFAHFETECLQKFGECVLKLSYNPQLAFAFLQLCLSCAHLKLLNMKYSPTKLLDRSQIKPASVSDLTSLLPCLTSEQWTDIAKKVTEEDALVVLNQLLLAKTMALSLQSSQNGESDRNDDISATKTQLIKHISELPSLLDSNMLTSTLLWDLDKQQGKQLAKTVVKLRLNNPECEIFNMEAVASNRRFLNAIVLETAVNITKCMTNVDGLSKALGKSNFDFPAFAKEFNMKKILDEITLNENQDNLLTCIEILRHIPLDALEENYQLVAIFLLLATKKCCQSKKLKKNVDHVLQKLFELSPKHPDLYKVFPLNYIFFDEQNLLKLLTLKIKTSNNLLIIKSLLENAVKKVRTDDKIVKSIVETLLEKQAIKMDEKMSIEYFSNPVFQISCVLLPLIAKERKVITNSAYRTILAGLQERLHKSMLECFKNIAFSDTSVSTDCKSADSVVVSESLQATLNAMAAFSLTLSKYCETNDTEEMKNLEYLWPGMEHFVLSAITSIQSLTPSCQYLESSIQLLNVALRHIKKLETHPVFQLKDIFVRIWKSILGRLQVDFRQGNRLDLSEELSTTLKFVCELTPVEQFNTIFIGDLNTLSGFKDVSLVQKEESPTAVTLHRVNKYLWTQCLKANLVAPKCAALAKLLHKMCKNSRVWIREYYRNQNGGIGRLENEVQRDRLYLPPVDEEIKDVELKYFTVDDKVCEMLRLHLDTVAEAVLAAKKISLDYKCLDCIFELQQQLHFLIGHNTTDVRCEVAWQSFCALFDGCLNILNSLLVSREELLEDRWPIFMQCYRALVRCLCELTPDEATDDKLAELAHKVEKLTQSITKRKACLSRIAAYSVADLCSNLERNAPNKMVRQHLENSIALLLQVSDSSYSAAFLRRALVGVPGHTTMTNMYTMYKRYHKYVGNC